MQRHDTHRAFTHIRSRHDTLGPFGDPVALVDWLHAGPGEPEHKNSVLRALVVEAQEDGPDAEAALTLLVLALWPGLDAVYRRQLRHFRREPDALAAEIAARLVTGVRTMDLARVTRIAATLVRNIDRDICRMLQRERREASARAPAEVLEGIEAEFSPPDASDCLIAREALTRVEATLGPDAGLVLDVVCRGLSQREAGAARGLGHAAARKRVQRALARLRMVEVAP